MLTKRQRDVARALFEGQLTEPEILERYKVSLRILQRWLGNPEFQQEFERLKDNLRREANFAMVRYTPAAVVRLVELLGSDKADVARRAALDLMDRGLEPGSAGEKADCEEDSQSEKMADEQVREMLVSLAAGYKKK